MQLSLHGWQQLMQLVDVIVDQLLILMEQLQADVVVPGQ
jgi:hypothetical protein